MRWLKRFWTQPNKRYRNFVIVYTLLALNFILPAFSYYIDPDAAVSSFYSIGELFDYKPSATEDSYIWWILGAGNVMTLGVMCALILVNVRRFYAILPALVCLKGLSSLGFLIVYIAGPHNPTFMGAALLDGVSVLLMLWFAIRANRSIDRDPTELVPQPVDGRRALRMGPKSRRRAGVVAAAILPETDESEGSEYPHSSTPDAIAEQIESAPLATGIGARALIRIVHSSPFVVIGKVRSLRGLDQNDRNRYLERLEESRFYAIRQAYQSLKALVSLAVLGQLDKQNEIGAYRSGTVRQR